MKDWKQCIVENDCTIYQALEKIDKSALQIALVVDKENHLVGTLTDGDIRRTLLRGRDLSGGVDKAMNVNPKIAKAGQMRKNILASMRSNNLRHLPIVDENNVLVGMEFLDELLQVAKKDNLVVLMAGGLGTRLRPLTDDCPKPMLKVGSRPILETILMSFREYGFYKFYFSVNYKSEMIKEYFQDGSRWGAEIIYLEESKRLGTAGALSLITEKQDKPLIVMNGDLLTQVNFQHLLDFHLETGSRATMCLRDYTYQIPYGVIDIEQDHIRKIAEKPVKSYFVNAGIYVLNPELIAAIPHDEFYDMPQLFNALLTREDKIGAFPLREYWLDIGRRDDFDRAQGEFPLIFK